VSSSLPATSTIGLRGLPLNPRLPKTMFLDETCYSTLGMKLTMRGASYAWGLDAVLYFSTDFGGTATTSIPLNAPLFRVDNQIICNDILRLCQLPAMFYALHHSCCMVLKLRVSYEYNTSGQHPRCEEDIDNLKQHQSDKLQRKRNTPASRPVASSVFGCRSRFLYGDGKLGAQRC
jgi:hypothetical protein